LGDILQERRISPFDSVSITPATKYIKVVIPAKAGIQAGHWVPDQVRHDRVGLFNSRGNNARSRSKDHKKTAKPLS
jgi:hypothetical protein